MAGFTRRQIIENSPCGKGTMHWSITFYRTKICNDKLLSNWRQEPLKSSGNDPIKNGLRLHCVNYTVVRLHFHVYSNEASDLKIRRLTWQYAVVVKFHLCLMFFEFKPPFIRNKLYANFVNGNQKFERTIEARKIIRPTFTVVMHFGFAVPYVRTVHRTFPSKISFLLCPRNRSLYKWLNLVSIIIQS